MSSISSVFLLKCFQFFYEEDLTLDLKNVDNQAKQIKYRYNKALL